MKFNNSSKIKVYLKQITFVLLVFTFLSCSEKEGTDNTISSSDPALENGEPTRNTFTIEGTVINGTGNKLFLFEYGGSSPIKLDSIILTESGEFKFTKTLDGYSFFSIGGSINNVLALLLKGGENVTVKTDFNQMSVGAETEGSEDTRIMNEFSMKQKEFFDAMQSLTNEIEALDYSQTSKREVIIEKANKLKSEFGEYNHAFIDKNSQSPAIYLSASELRDPTTDIAYLEKIEKTLIEKMKGSQFQLAISQTVLQAKQYLANAEQQRLQIEQQKQAFAMGGIEIGKTAPDLNYPDPDGKNISLSSLKGKIVLLDFWASWCRPCRSENPNVVRLYNQYKDKGFTVYSFSLDNASANWKNAIEQDGLVWSNHTSDLKGWESAGSALYNVSSIPQTFLIGRDGKIIDIGLRGIELENKLKELLD